MKDKHNEVVWSHIYWLGVLQRTGSFTGAARHLGVSKAAVSQRIAELEQLSGVALVQRTTRSVRLTDAGQALVRRTHQAFDTIEQGFDSVRDLADEARGVLRLTAPVALGRQEIIPALGRFLQTHPDVRIELELSDHLSSLAQEGFDLAIRHTSAVPDTYVAWLLRPTETLLVATPEYLEQHGEPHAPADLARHNCLYYLRSAAAPSWSFAPRHAPAERMAVPIRGNFCANNSEALRELVMAHQGLAMLPDFSALREVQAGRLKAVMTQWLPSGVFGNSIFAIRPYSAYVPRAVRLLVDHLRQSIRNASPAG